MIFPFFKKREPEKGIAYQGDPYILVEGAKYRAKIDSVQTLKKLESLERQMVELQEKFEETPNTTSKTISVVQDLVLLLLGADAYQAIFDTAEKKDSYGWHSQVFQELLRVTFQHKVRTYNDSVFSDTMQEMKKIQQQMNRAQRRRAKKS